MVFYNMSIMKKLFLLFLLFLTACASFAEPSFPVNQYPTPFPTPTLAVMTKPMGDAEKEAAQEFFYHVKVHLLSVEFEHIAEEVRYPITVNVEDQPKTYAYTAEFAADFKKIFNDELTQKITSTDESELSFTPNGVKVADGIIWFDLICMDPGCNEAEFLITQINN